MEARITKLELEAGAVRESLKRLEGAVDKIADRLGRMEVDIARLDGRISGLPTTWVLVTAILAGQATLLGFAFVLLRYLRP
jgi:predicted nuclease with TOPRIM domain